MAKAKVMQTEDERRSARRQLMLEGNLLRVIPMMALPQVVTMLIDSLYNMADTYFVSQLGSVAMAAVGINDSLMSILRAIALAFGMGAASYISRLLGAGKDEEASKAASTNLFTAIGVVLLVAVLCLMFLSPLVDFLGSTPEAKEYSMSYARWTLLFAPFTAASVCLSQTLRGEGSATYAMIGSVSGCVINVFLDPVFITTMGLGVAGAAIATGISKVISVTILLVPYLRRKCVLRMSLRLFSPSRDLYSEIARMGIPTALRTSLMSVSFILMNNLAGGFGAVIQAAVTVANKCMRLVGSAVLGFGQGFQPIAGFCWGAKKYRRVKQAFLYTSAIGIVIGVVLGVLLGVFAEPVLLLFSSEAELIDIGMVLIRSQCLVLPFHVWIMIATGLFTATGKALQAGLLGLSRQAFSLIPCVLILTHFWGITGLTLSQAVSDVISFTMGLLLIIPTVRELNRLIAQEGAEPSPSDDSPAIFDPVEACLPEKEVVQ